MKSILAQLISLQVICAVLATGVLWKLSERSFTDSMSKSFLSSAETVTESLARTVELPMGNKEFTPVQSALDATLKLPNVEWAFVTTPDGRVVADTFVPVFPAELLQPVNSRARGFVQTADPKRPLVVFTEPVMGGIFGYVHIGFNQDALAASIAREKLLILTTVGVVLFIKSVLIGLRTRQLLEPIRRLTQSSLDMASNLTADFVPLPIKSGDELGTLTSSFNRMTLERQEDRRSLEARVLARTQDLLLANAELEAAKVRAESATLELRSANARLEAEATERKFLEVQLVHAQKLESIGQLAAGVAHEINTPIQYIGDNCLFLKTSFVEMQKLILQHGELMELVRAKNLNTELVARLENDLGGLDAAFLVDEIPRAIEQSIEGVERVSQIVRAMKEFSHPGSGEKAPVDLNHAIMNTLMVCRNEVKYAATVVTDLDPALPPVHCLIGEMNQVILNLVVNAAHAMEETGKDGTAGRIQVSTRLDGAFAEIRVQDNGCGIPENIRNKIFDPFFTTKEVGKGTGQGLAIARNAIVKKHGGTLTFETEQNVGTTFVVRIPIEPSEESVASQREYGSELADLMPQAI